MVNVGLGLKDSMDSGHEVIPLILSPNGGLVTNEGIMIIISRT